MSKKPVTKKAEAEKVVKDIRRATRKIHSAEEKIRVVLAGLRGEDSIAELCRREGIAHRHQKASFRWTRGNLRGTPKGCSAFCLMKPTAVPPMPRSESM